MRVFAKDVSGQKLDRGFESRPLRLVQKVEANVPCFSNWHPRLLEKRAVVSLHDAAETALMPRRPRARLHSLRQADARGLGRANGLPGRPRIHFDS